MKIDKYIDVDFPDWALTALERGVGHDYNYGGDLYRFTRDGGLA